MNAQVSKELRKLPIAIIRKYKVQTPSWANNVCCPVHNLIPIEVSNQEVILAT